MHRELKINLSEDFAVLCSFWNKTPEQIIQFYLDHVSMSAMVNKAGIDPREKSFYSDEELKILLARLKNDPFGLSTYFTINYVPLGPRQVYSNILPKISKTSPL